MENKKPAVKPNDLSGKDVVKEGGYIAKDVVKTTITWLLAGALTDAIRKVISKK